MRYKTGFKIKPLNIKSTGLVTFTDGTNECDSNQETCEAYGYKYSGGACYAFVTSTDLIVPNENETLINNGGNNQVSLNNGSIINGSSHVSKNSQGCFITGQNNEISPRGEILNETYVNNSSIIGGRYAHATQDGQIVFGGGGGDGPLKGQHQMVTCSIAGESAGNDINFYLQGDGSLEDHGEVYLPDNSIVIFELHLSGLCTGGSSGTIGHYKTHVQTGTCLTNDDGAITYDAGTTTTTASVGSTGTVAITVSEANTLRIGVAGAANVNATWHGIVKLYINQTTRVTF